MSAAAQLVLYAVVAWAAAAGLIVAWCAAGRSARDAVDAAMADHYDTETRP